MACLRSLTRRSLLLCSASLLLAASLSSVCAQNDFSHAIRNGKRPRLAVVISIDQFRADILYRNADLFLPPKMGAKPGGFRYLMTAGSFFANARHDHFPTFTGPGHSVLLTGANPATNGILANEWWDKETNSVKYCVDDPRFEVVGKAAGSKATPMGPLNLRASTLGDELKLATGKRSRLVSIALKDRAAILMGGHMADACLWFDDNTGRWISSGAYCKTGDLPAWAKQINDAGIPDKHLGKTWERSLPASALERTLDPQILPLREPYGMGLTFPHKIGKERVRASYKAFSLTPYANDYVFETAKAAIRAEKMGSREGVPDLLTINLSTNDYVGHAFGPFSPEALEIAVQTDRSLSNFFSFLQETIPGGLSQVVLVVTGDHGVVPIVEQLQQMGANAGRVLDSALEETAEKALRDAFGEANWVTTPKGGKPLGAYVEPYFYFNEAAVKNAIDSGKAKNRAEIQSVVAEAVAKLPGIYACYTRAQLMQNALPQTDLNRRIVHGFHPKLSGDVVVVTEQLFYTDPGGSGPYSTSHGTPYVYDAHVPILISGFGVRSGVWTKRVTPIDIAPTLALLLGVEFPSGCEGHPLSQALR